MIPRRGRLHLRAGKAGCFGQSLRFRGGRIAEAQDGMIRGYLHRVIRRRDLRQGRFDRRMRAQMNFVFSFPTQGLRGASGVTEADVLAVAAGALGAAEARAAWMVSGVAWTGTRAETVGAVAVGDVGIFDVNVAAGDKLFFAPADVAGGGASGTKTAGVGIDFGDPFSALGWAVEAAAGGTADKEAAAVAR